MKHLYQDQVSIRVGLISYELRIPDTVSFKLIKKLKQVHDQLGNSSTSTVSGGYAHTYEILHITTM